MVVYFVLFLYLTGSSTLHNPQASATIDVEVTSTFYILHYLALESLTGHTVIVVQGSEFHDSHSVRFRKPSYCVELDLDDVKKETPAGRNEENGLYNWDESLAL